MKKDVLEEKVARNKAEETSKKYLKNKIIEGTLNFDHSNISNLINDLKILGSSPMQTILFLKENLNYVQSQSKIN